MTIHEKDIEGQYMEPYKTFLVPFGSTKLNIFMRKNSVKNREKPKRVIMKKHPRFRIIK